MTDKRPKAGAAADALKEPLPHEGSRESNQPYAKEIEDYVGGVAAPPEENPDHPPPRKPSEGAGP